ncbi:hypothetical protein P0O24_03365 [Methanotrichaceae archaeon M04Ac]|uniref:Uncharacterized protein n=1 Tax=Candidatus Methanocrinis alkalitolerans TaxID=3033395 RepID=A0ABT5XD48_9EURY|nr:hypothetical protein [Candidatus Methanocrinis alkalitolerans]MDF0592619.1 hypothetical protein [Candidatus Methanocrinis alkalitolerans]
MKRELAVLLVLGMALVGMAGAANYMYEKANIKGVGYKNVEIIIQTQTGLNGNKLVEKESGSGNVITQRMELEAQRDPFNTDVLELVECCPDYINFTKEAEFEYMPVSYQTGTYDQKWIEKLCVQNYYIGAVVVEMYTHAEHLQKNTEVKTRKQCCDNSTGDLSYGAGEEDGCGCCTGALEANFNSNVIGVAHLGWLSKDPMVNSKGRHDEYGRSVEDLTGVFSIEKFIQLWGNETCGAVQVDWLPCI